MGDVVGCSGRKCCNDVAEVDFYNSFLCMKRYLAKNCAKCGARFFKNCIVRLCFVACWAADAECECEGVAVFGEGCADFKDTDFFHAEEVAIRRVLCECFAHVLSKRAAKVAFVTCKGIHKR